MIPFLKKQLLKHINMVGMSQVMVLQLMILVFWVTIR